MPEEGSATNGQVGGISAEQAAQISWVSVLSGGVAAVVAASQAIAVAVETRALSVDPHLVDAMIKKLTEMQDELGKVGRNSQSLSMDTQLGGGYAEQISQNNRTFGEGAMKTLTEMGKALDELKTQIEKSRASYQNVDQSHADSLKKLDGKS